MHIPLALRYVWILCLGLLASATGLRADDTTYTDQASFLAATLPGYYQETFDSLPEAEVLSAPLPFSMNGFSYTASAANGFFNVSPDGIDLWLSANTAGDAITFNMISNNVTAIGGFFFLTNFIGLPAGGIITVALDNGTMLTSIVSSSSDFTGFTTSVPIVSLTLTPTLGGPLRWATVNNLAVGVAAPEGGTTIVLLGVGVLGLLVCSRRCRTTSGRT